MISVSVCMIVKNEEAVLERCLNSLKSIADEIIVVDTGSTDNTKKIAQKFTNKIYDFEWVNDFSLARNHSISKATKDYIYIADADEIIDEENCSKFLRLKETLIPEIDVVEMIITNQLEFNTTYNFDSEYRPKLFKRLRPFYFIDPIHEVLDLTAHSYQCDVKIIHKPVQCHADRDLTIFSHLTKKRTQLSERLNDMYARELFIAGRKEDFQNAFAYFCTVLENENSTENEIKTAECVIARYANENNENHLFFKTVSKHILNTPCAEICCEMGDYFFSREDFKEAVLWYHTAAFQAVSELNIHYAGDIALKKLTDCFQKLELYKEAQEYRELAQNWKIPDKN